MDDSKRFEPLTISITSSDRKMLDELLAWWYPDDGRVLSMTIRRCIREAHEREKAKHEGREGI